MSIDSDTRLLLVVPGDAMERHLFRPFDSVTKPHLLHKGAERLLGLGVAFLNRSQTTTCLRRKLCGM
jgi:hypothetical protein